MRDDFKEFERRNVAILAIAPHDLAESVELAASLDAPYPVLADPALEVFASYDVQSRLWSLGQRPAVYLIDPNGMVRWAYQGTQQWDIPKNGEVLATLDALIATEPRPSAESR